MISGRVLKLCAEQLCDIFHHIFMMSRQQQKVPRIWKSSIIVPVNKVNTPKVLNDIRPVALTSLVMKQFEKLIKEEILQHIQDRLDPLQFAYRAGRGVEDATLYLLHLLLTHLEIPHTHARLLFIDFSSAFNTIQPHILADKLISLFELDPNIVGWIVDFLTNRSQCVRVNGVLSKQLLSSTGSPQGCCLSPLLYIMYTNDCRSYHDNRTILKFADDSVIVSLLRGQEAGHGPVVDDFVTWCDQSFLQLNVNKTKDMIIDFRTSAPVPSVTTVKGTDLELVDSYKYLGTIIDRKLLFKENTLAVCSKVQQRLFFLRKMRSFSVCSTMMMMFYRSFIESVLSFCMASWYGNLNQEYKDKLDRHVKGASKIIGVYQAQLSVVYEQQVLRIAKNIIGSPAHPLHRAFELLPLGRRYRSPPGPNNRFRYSFVPTAIGLLNTSS